MGSEKKTRYIKIRASEVLFRKLVAICEATGKTKTSLITDFILKEYDKKKEYERFYYKNLDKKM